MTFAEQVKDIRKRLYLSQQNLAEELNISFATINRWEGGKHDPSWQMKKKFYDYCSKMNIKFEE